MYIVKYVGYLWLTQGLQHVLTVTNTLYSREIISIYMIYNAGKMKNMVYVKFVLYRIYTICKNKVIQAKGLGLQWTKPQRIVV